MSDVIQIAFVVMAIGVGFILLAMGRALVLWYFGIQKIHDNQAEAIRYLRSSPTKTVLRIRGHNPIRDGVQHVKHPVF